MKSFLNFHAAHVTFIFIILTLSTAGCNKATVLPKYPPMPEEVKQVLRDNYSPMVHKWLNDQVRLKKKLELGE